MVDMKHIALLRKKDKIDKLFKDQAMTSHYKMTQDAVKF